MIELDHLLSRPVISDGPSLGMVLRALKEAGGRPLIVGGWVRDYVMGVESADIDIEVFGMHIPDLEATLGELVPLVLVGKAFAVYKVQGAGVEFSLPRRDSLVGMGHRGFAVEALPDLTFREASRRRDFTINAMGLDPFTGELFDPWGGRDHLTGKLLDLVDPERFHDDPLRVLRGAQFVSRFLLAPSPRLVACSRTMSAEELPQERVFTEMAKVLLGARPSLGLRFLRVTGWLRFLPEVAAMVGLPQDPAWHPEGDVWKHVLTCLDAAVPLRIGDSDRDLMLMLGVLCHDLGKIATTRTLNGRIRSIGHSDAGVEITRRFLSRFTRDRVLITGVGKLVREHLVPEFLCTQHARLPAIRRLANRLAPEVDIELLERCSRADYWGTGPRHGVEFPAGTWLLNSARTAGVLAHPEEPVLLGRHLLEAGLSPGPRLGALLRRAYEIQTEEGIRDIAVLRDRVLSDASDASGATPASARSVRGAEEMSV